MTDDAVWTPVEIRRATGEDVPALAGTLVAALETSSPDNVRLYERLGFAVTGEVQVPAGPHVWLMRRWPAP